MPPHQRPAGRTPRLPPPPEQYAAVRFPEAGLDLSQPFGLPRVRTTPVGLNVRLHEGLTQRGRGGSRAGLGRFVPAQLPSGAHRVQDLNVVVDPAGVALLGNYDFNPADLYDPSSFGPATSWGVGPLDSQGLPIPPLPTSRNSGWVLRVGGTGVQPNKNDRSGVWIKWPVPADINAGTPLSGDQLDAVGTDPRTLLPLPGGTYVYNPPAGTVLPAGSGQVLAVTYTPDDTVHYRGGTATVTINVKPPLVLAFVQAAGAGAVGLFNNPAPVSVLLPAPATQGDLLLVVVASVLEDFETFAVTVTDTLGTLYTQVGLASFSLTGLQLWSGRAAATGPCTATVTPGAPSGAFLSLGLLQYTGAGAQDGYGSNVNTSVASTTLSTGPIPVSVPVALVVGALTALGAQTESAFTADSGPTVRVQVQGDVSTSLVTLVVLEKLPVASVQTLTGTIAPALISDPNIGLGVSFKPA